MSKIALFRLYRTKRGITILSLVCLSLMYIILSFSYALLPLHRKSVFTTPQSIDTTYNDTHSSFSHDQSEERFLAYLPHSGLSNQRIELANALLMAYMLNRTLIVPPAFLGTVFGWSKREQLESQLEWLTTPKDFARLCSKPTPKRLSSYVYPTRCSSFNNIAVVAWSELHDLDRLMPDIRIRYQPIYTEKQMKQDLELQGDHDILRYYDDQLYDWRLYENKTFAQELLGNEQNYFDSFGGRRYYKVLSPHHFAQLNQRLLYLGGIFGSTRLNLVSPKYINMYGRIKSVLHYRLDTPLGETVNAIVDHLGGRGAFQSIHFRTGDKPFRKQIDINLNRFIQDMATIVRNDFSSSEQDTVKGTRCLGTASGTTMDWHETITIPYPSRNYAKVYIATDYHKPRKNQSKLLPFFQEFPCTVTLDDIPDELLSRLDSIRDIMDPSKPLKKHLIPLVDAMVAAHGKSVLTTPRSTFSQYIKELHKAWL